MELDPITENYLQNVRLLDAKYRPFKNRKKVEKYVKELENLTQELFRAHNRGEHE